MGSTAIGRAFDSAASSAGDILKSPNRAALAVATLGGSEVLRATDNVTGKNLDRNFNGGARELEVQQKKVGEQEAATEKMFSDMNEQQRQQSLTRERDLSRARQRAMSANKGGRSSTILTNPSSYFGAQGGYTPGTKQLLGQ